MRSKLSSWPWWIWVGSISLALVLVTVLVRYLPWAVARWLVYFDLAIEMNLAALWSSLLLATIALLALENWSGEHNLFRNTAWLILGLILLLLSWDELGSLHERGGGFSDLLPYIVAFVLLLAVSLGILFLDRETRWMAVGLGVMFFLFGSVILQERIEHLISWPEWARGVRVGIEEGSELLGFGIGLASLIRKRGLSPKTAGLAAIVPDLNRIKNLPIWLIAGLGLHLGISVLTAAGYQPGELGNPAIWLPVLFYYLLFCLAFWRAHRHQAHRAWLFLAIYFLLSTVMMVYLVAPRSEVSLINSLGLLANPYFFWGVQLLIVTLLVLRIFPGKSRQALINLGITALLLVLGAIMENLVGLFVIAGVFPLALLFLFCLILENEPLVQPAVFEMPLGGKSIGG